MCQGPYGPRPPASGALETLSGRYVWCRRKTTNPLLRFEGIGRRSIYGPEPCSLKSLKLHWAYSSVGLEHTPDKREVGSSNLPRPTTYRDSRDSTSRGAVAQLGE